MNRSSFVSKLFTPVITLLVLAYFGYQIYGYVSDPFSTTLAYTYQVEDTVDISGYVVRQVQVLGGAVGFVASPVRCTGLRHEPPLAAPPRRGEQADIIRAWLTAAPAPLSHPRR